MKKIIFLVFSFGVFYFFRIKIIALILSIFFPPEELSQSMKEKYDVYGIISEHINQKYGLNGGMIGSKNNISRKKVEGLFFIFQKEGKVLQDEVREILIKILLEVLLKINQEKRLAKYFLPYPFTSKNLDLSIIFKNKCNLFYEFEPYIGTILFAKNGLIFSKFSRLSNENPTWCSRESFEEAFEKVKASLPHELQLAGENSIQRSRERDLEDANTCKEGSDDEFSIDKWHELAIAPRDNKGYLIPKK